MERRQFGDGHRGLSGAGRELALAIDRYKLRHHRRYLTCDEILRVIKYNPNLIKINSMIKQKTVSKPKFK